MAIKSNRIKTDINTTTGIMLKKNCLSQNIQIGTDK